MSKKVVYFWILCFILIVFGVMWFGRVKFEIKNELGIKLNVSQISGNIFLLKSGYWKKDKKIEIIYTNDQQIGNLLIDAETKKVISSTFVDNSNQKTSFVVHYDSEFFPKLVEQPGRLSRDVMIYLCMYYERTSDRNMCGQKVINFEKWSKLFALPELIKTNKTKRLSLVSQVYAGCSGTIYCGTEKTTCTCVGDSTYNSQCGASTDKCGPSPDFNAYDCSCDTQCDGAGASPNDCTSLTSESYCTDAFNQFCSVSNDCRLIQECSWCTPDWPSPLCDPACGIAAHWVYDGCGNRSWCDATAACCTPSSPSVPGVVSPPPPSTTKTATANLVWTTPASWGVECVSGTRGYEVCYGPSAADPCVGGTSVFVSGDTSLSYAMTSSVANVYWKVRARNTSLRYSAWSSPLNFCFAGSDPVNPLSVTEWSVCDPVTHLRTRSCIAGCDCTGISLSEVCQGEIRGTLFDASARDVCPGSDANGYLTGLLASEYVPGATFLVVDQAGTAPGGWSSSLPQTTTGTGNYSAIVYAPATYDYDFGGLSGFDVAGGPKLTCTSSVATVFGGAPSCLIQPCSLVTNMSFGFYRVFGGWLQAVGGSVYAGSGLESNIPASVVPASNQKLILADGNGRSGVLSHGFTWLGSELGTNPGAAVSGPLWRVQSLYDGLRYDYNFYNTRMDVFAFTPWDGGEINLSIA